MHIDKERERQSGNSEKRKEGTNLSSGETKEMEERENKKVKLIEEKDEGERQKRISSWISASSRGEPNLPTSSNNALIMLPPSV